MVSLSCHIHSYYLNKGLERNWLEGAHQGRVSLEIKTIRAFLYCSGVAGNLLYNSCYTKFGEGFVPHSGLQPCDRETHICLYTGSTGSEKTNLSINLYIYKLSSVCMFRFGTQTVGSRPPNHIHILDQGITAGDIGYMVFQDPPSPPKKDRSFGGDGISHHK